MNKVNKKAKYINLSAQCVLCISVAVFSITNIMDIEVTGMDTTTSITTVKKEMQLQEWAAQIEAQ
ncbi:hypothetical protein [Ruminococcus albus]|uniref:Uncharacterized protein n=1 Tax=Ruminococcus albus TaxID=1264 RepID=A0A1I1QT42_RUMAL|nr:hypothetical protein [Ruminococcus albus]SFD25172.1 hypothetical protein SAMN02910406_03504 [Ruminococcus albus]